MDDRSREHGITPFHIKQVKIPVAVYDANYLTTQQKIYFALCKEQKHSHNTIFFIVMVSLKLLRFFNDSRFKPASLKVCLFTLSLFVLQ
jgi:hypothetical protein